MQSGTEGCNMFFSKRKKIQYEREYEKERPWQTRNKMKRPPALYVVYTKSVYKSYCGFPFANHDGHKFYGFWFENYKRAAGKSSDECTYKELMKINTETFNRILKRRGEVLEIVNKGNPSSYIKNEIDTGSKNNCFQWVEVE